MKVLYISESYATSKVHHNLCQNVARLGCQMQVFSIQRKGFLTDLKASFGQKDYEWTIDTFDGNNFLYKYAFAYKQRYKLRKLVQQTDMSGVGVVHATTLFSDGALALKLKRERAIPYIVSVRGTDTDIYARMMVHLWPKGREILRNAERIVFISDTLRQTLFSRPAFRSLKEELMSRTEIIPNGIDDVWLENLQSQRRPLDPAHPRIVYIGRLDTNKNVLALMDAIDQLANRHPGAHLSIIGGGGQQEPAIRQRCNNHPERYQMLGKIYDKNQLRSLLRQQDVFALVSHSETFGLVYLEALSQALPILYSQGRGIDGVFDEPVGEPVDPAHADSIAEGLEKIISHPEHYAILGQRLKRFAWQELAKRYVHLYQQAMSHDQTT